MKNWGMLYEKQPVPLDAVLFAVALMLHLPLLTLHMKAPPKTKGKSLSKLVNIDYIEEQIKKRKEKPIMLPPKMPDASAEMAKKMEEVKQHFKRSLPPPPPPKTTAAEPSLAKGPEVGKLEANLKDKLSQQQKTLEGKGSFQGKDLKLSGPDASKDLKIAAGGAGAIAGGSRLSGIAAPKGGTLQSKSGFQVSKDAAPSGIGGGDEGGLKIGGGGVIVLPTGGKAHADASILSPVAAKKDKGPLMAQGPAVAGPAGSSAGPGLAGGAGAAAPIGGGRTTIAAPAGGAVKEGKKLEDKQLPNPLVEPAKPAAAPALGTLPRRITPKVQKPLFLISGPLANRQVLTREVPAYPEWARERGVESAVVLQFTVTPEGNVKDNIIVVRTSGYPQMDELAVKALLKWKFVALPADQYREEVGSITFNFSIQ